MDTETFWLIIGFTGQGLFAMRFLVQWWRSEQAHRSIIPIEFWYLSIAGSVVLLMYAMHKVDPVFIVGQLTGVFIYLRNLHLIKENKRLTAALDNSN